MPPKEMQKALKRKAIEEAKTTSSTAEVTKPKAKKPKIVCPQISLPVSGDHAVRVDVNYEGTVVSALSKGCYTHTLKLHAENAFSLVNTYTAADGKQIIVIQPAKAFNFLGLPKPARDLVYQFYLANKNMVDEPISFEGKRKASTDMYAKTYAAGSKTRLGLLTANRQIHSEATPLLYAKPFKLDNPTGLVNLMMAIDDDAKERIRRIQVNNWTKTATSKHALAFLAGANSLESFYIGAGVCTEDDPAKAARVFWNDCSRLLLALGRNKPDNADRGEVVGVLRFGRAALQTKNGKDYSKEQKELFMAELRKRLL